MAKKDAQLDEEIIDLTELIESGNKGDGRAAAAYAKTAPAEDDGEDDDFAAILAETTGGSDHKVDPDEQLDMSGMGGIDNLLDSLDIPPQPKSGAPRKEASGDDLDSALDDLLGADEPKSAPASDLDSDLESLLDDMAPPPKPTPKSAASTNSDLDALLNGDISTPKAAPHPASEVNLENEPKNEAGKPVQSPAMVELDSDLDDILASFDSPEPPKTASAAKPAPKTDEKNIAADLDDILGEVELPTPPKQTAPEREYTSMEEPAVSEPAAAQAGEQHDLSSELDVPEELDDLLEASLPPPTPASDLPAQMQTPSKGSPPVPMQTGFSPEALVSICRNLSTGSDPAGQQALQSFARELGEQTAHIEDMAGQIAQLGKRLLACESKLSAARARIASLEKAMESAAALEDLLKEGTQLHSGFMALVSTAVANALKGIALSGADTVLQAKVEKLLADSERANKRMTEIEGELAGMSQGRIGIEEEVGRLISDNDNSSAKIKTLENKISLLEQNSGEEMEKAAAATVARLLHEEISRLAQE